MRAKVAVVRASGTSPTIEEVDVDEPRAGEILVRLVASGVSGRDRAAIAGALAMPLPFVPGCEGAGVVAKIGEDVTNVAVGDAVLLVSPPGSPDRDREFSGTRPDGSAPFRDEGGAINGFFCGQSSFATHLICRADLAIAVEEGAPLELLAGLVGEVLTGAGIMLQAFEVAAGDSLVITGGNAAGLGACMAAAAAGASPIILADPDETRRALALDVGATIAVPADDGLSIVVRSLVADGVRFALEASGSDTARSACLASLAKGGAFTALDDARAADRDVTEGIATGDVSLVPTSIGLDAAALVRRLLALHGEGRFPIEKLVSWFPFEQVADALAAAESGEVVKPVLRFSLGAFDALDRALQEGAATDEADGDPASEPSGDDSPVDREREAPPVLA